MNCWHCGRPANGVCKFCGRALCKDHSKTMPYILDIYPSGEKRHKALAVDNVLFCGICQPKPEPVEMEDL